MATKTNAMRILDQLKITYQLSVYEVDDEDVSAEHVAAALGVAPESLYKTLVLKGLPKGCLVAVIPGNAHLDLKKLAKVSGNKNCEMVPMKDLQKITGYIRGGCSPVGMKKLLPTFIQTEASSLSVFTVSAGKRGLQLTLSPDALCEVINGQFVDIII